MKRAISLFLVLMMALLLCSCGEKSKSSATPQSKDYEEIKFEDVVLVDNEKMKIELVMFYSDFVNWGDRVPANEKYIVVKATNKTDHEFFLNADRFYINDELMHVLTAHGSIAPDPGKTQLATFIIDHDTIPKPTALDSMDELYLLEGKFSGVEKFDEYTMNNRNLEVSFSIPEALNK